VPSDLFTLKALARELDEALKGGRIDKITMPEPDEVRLTFRAGGENRTLVLSASPEAPRCHLTSSRRENPPSPPSFCMLLRKHLSGARLERLSAYLDDRILELKFTAKNEFFEDTQRFLYIELIGRFSNVVLTDENGIVLDAVKHIPPAENHLKCVLPRSPYKTNPQDKIPFDSKEIVGLIEAFSGGCIRDFLNERISGLGRATLNEILFRANIDSDAPALSESEKSALVKVFSDFANPFESGLYSPSVSLSEKADYFVCPYLSLKVKFERKDSLNSAADEVFEKTAAALYIKAKTRALVTPLKRNIANLEKLTAQILTDIELTKKAEDFKKWGELLTCNLHAIKRGDEKAEVFDYYLGETVTIPLDIKLSPSDNAAAYYKKYRKLKRGAEHLSAQLEEKSALLEYLNSVMLEISELKASDEIADIETELVKVGVVKPKGAKQKTRPSLPLRYLVEGFEILKGKNNLQNEEITFKVASGGDVWLHKKNSHGAHVVILTRGRAVPAKVLKTAAEIAAYPDSAAVEVDYTERRRVRRKKDALPGMVIYTDYSTIRAEPNAHFEFFIKE
jgi:predicted ribosome quality control (RQC) complex YloA/Tae2 family protein